MVDVAMSLTPEQRLAVDCDRNILLTACPGSGKTRTIIAKLIKEVERLRGTPRAVACITYTNSAVQEIEHRSAILLKSGDETNFIVSTIHAFCLNNILRPFAWRFAGFTSLPKILTRDNPDFELISQHAASQIGYLNLTPSDYEAFEGLNIDAAGAITFDAPALTHAVRDYGTVRTQKFFAPLLSHVAVKPDKSKVQL